MEERLTPESRTDGGGGSAGRPSRWRFSSRPGKRFVYVASTRKTCFRPSARPSRLLLEIGRICGNLRLYFRLVTDVYTLSIGLSMTASLVDRILARDPRAIARAISKIENDSPDANEILKALFARTGRGLTVGVTGAPGAGKSSLV